MGYRETTNNGNRDEINITLKGDIVLELKAYAKAHDVCTTAVVEWACENWIGNEAWFHFESMEELNAKVLENMTYAEKVAFVRQKEKEIKDK